MKLWAPIKTTPCWLHFGYLVRFHVRWHSNLTTLENVDILNAFALVPFENSGSFNMAVNKDYGEVYLSEDHKAGMEKYLGVCDGGIT